MLRCAVRDRGRLRDGMAACRSFRCERVRVACLIVEDVLGCFLPHGRGFVECFSAFFKRYTDIDDYEVGKTVHRRLAFLLERGSSNKMLD